MDGYHGLYHFPFVTECGGSKIDLSATNQLIQNIYEFRSLLKYLGENHPAVLDEWKSKGVGSATQTPIKPGTTLERRHQNGQQVIR